MANIELGEEGRRLPHVLGVAAPAQLDLAVLISALEIARDDEPIPAEIAERMEPPTRRKLFLAPYHACGCNHCGWTGPEEGKGKATESGRDAAHGLRCDKSGAAGADWR